MTIKDTPTPDTAITTGAEFAGAQLVQPRLEAAGSAANQFASSAVFRDYTSRKSINTIRAQLNDLTTFVKFLKQVDAVDDGFEPAVLQERPESWQGVTWGLVEAFVKWLLAEGYAVGTVNRKLSTLKVYAKLATKAGCIDPAEHALIRIVSGYSHREAKRIDEKRAETRRSAKKASNVSLTRQQAEALKEQPDTPQGRRDAVIMCLLLDHGLRVGELAALKMADVLPNSGTFRFYRSKVDKMQLHRLSDDALAALKRWFALDLHQGRTIAQLPLLYASLKNGELGKPGMSSRAITARVCHLGETLGIFGLSAHDCRHYRATQAARHGTDAFALRDAGGWNSLAMPSRYIEENEVANAGVKTG